MLFNSIDFLIFFPIVTIAYFLIPHRFRYLWLLFASYYFYMCWNPKYALLMATSTVITWASGILIDRANNKKNKTEQEKTKEKKLWVALSFISNLAILFFFKYFDFALANVNAVLAQFNFELIQPAFDVVLPVGISFYTFQALSYTVDIYRKEIYAEKNILKYALFVSFFPQLVAGPIERSSNLLKQIQNVHLQKKISYEKFTNGFALMLYGYFQKVFIADKAAVLANTVFAAPEQYTTIELALGAIAFSIQIYGDFGGYSNIEIGAAQVLGFDMMENFNTPYFATSIQDFWRRWHISLSSWFKDYVYIPLGGNRCGKLRRYFNLMVTFLVSGLWHGAQMTYVVWGGIHGFIQILEKEVAELIQKLGVKVKTEAFSYKLLKMLFTYFIVTIAWIFFRADNVSIAIAYIRQMFTNFEFAVLFNGSLFKLGLVRNDMTVLCIGIVILFLTELVRYKNSMRIEKYLCTQNLWFKWTVLLVMILCVVLFGEYGINYNAAEFIYFQF